MSCKTKQATVIRQIRMTFCLILHAEAMPGSCWGFLGQSPGQIWNEWSHKTTQTHRRHPTKPYRSEPFNFAKWWTVAYLWFLISLGLTCPECRHWQTWRSNLTITSPFYPSASILAPVQSSSSALTGLLMFSQKKNENNYLKITLFYRFLGVLQIKIAIYWIYQSKYWYNFDQ